MGRSRLRRQPVDLGCGVIYLAAAEALAVCPCRELHSATMVMKPAEDRPRDESTEPLDRSRGRRIIAQGQVRSELVVIARVVGKKMRRKCVSPRTTI